MIRLVRNAPGPLACLLLGVFAVFVIWKAVLVGQWVPEAVLPDPIAVMQLGWAGLTSGQLLEYGRVSGLRLIIGFTVGGSMGVLIGAALGASRLPRDMFMPIFETLRPIPPLAWIPLAMIWFGIDESSKIFLIALAVFFPVFITTLKGVQHIDFNLLRAALSMDVTRTQMFFKIALPAAVPDIVTGLRLGWSMGLISLVGAEMIASNSGLGYMIMDGMNNGRFDQVILGILIIGFISILTDMAFVRFISSKLLHWHDGLEKHGA